MRDDNAGSSIRQSPIARKNSTRNTRKGRFRFEPKSDSWKNSNENKRQNQGDGGGGVHFALAIRRFPFLSCSYFFCCAAAHKFGEQVEVICLADGLRPRARSSSGISFCSRKLLLAGEIAYEKREMNANIDRHDFASDNTAAICPEAWAALADANQAGASSYGDDQWTQRVRDLVREIFETDCEVFLVSTAPPRTRWRWRNYAVLSQHYLPRERAHSRRTNAARRSFSAAAQNCFRRKERTAKSISLKSKSTIARQAELHAQKPRVLSITQATELGTVYTIEEVRAAGEFVRKHGLRLHMDGARFANAIAALNCAPKTISWEAGVDVLCFGGTKNGGAGSELVIFFQKQLAAEFDYRVKQAGQLASKMRFLAAPWIGLLQNNVWLGNAAKANGAGKLLADKLRALGLEIVYPWMRTLCSCESRIRSRTNCIGAAGSSTSSSSPTSIDSCVLGR